MAAEATEPTPPATVHPRPDAARTVAGRLVLLDRVAPGRILVADGRIEAIELDEAESDGPLVAPGFVDLHVHGWGGHDAMGPDGALDGMARGLLARGVTSFLPTAVTAPLATLARFAERVRRWLPVAPPDGAAPLGFNLEGPFIAATKKGAHRLEFIRDPAGAAWDELEPLLDGLRLTTIAPELPGALELIGALRERGVAVSLGHSAATLEVARAGQQAGAVSATHLFNAMSGTDHRHPGLAVAALTADETWTELIADRHHVHPSLWPIVTRSKPRDRLLLVSDAMPLAGTGLRRASIGGLQVEMIGERCVVAGTDTLAGSVIGLDAAVRNLVAEGTPLPAAVAAASANPAALLGATDRGRIAPGCRADLVELDDDLAVQRVMRDGAWFGGRAAS